jgi:hypothetical protein
MSGGIAAVPKINRLASKQERFEDYLIISDFLYGHRSVLDFEVLEIAGEQVAPFKAVLFKRRGDTFDEWTADPTAADVFLSGSIKWDGCSNWNFDAQQDCMLHFCGVKQASGIGRLMARMYDIAAAEIESFDRELAYMPPQIDATGSE